LLIDDPLATKVAFRGYLEFSNWYQKPCQSPPQKSDKTAKT